MRVLVTTDIPQHHDYASLPATLVPHMACTSSSLLQSRGTLFQEACLVDRSPW